MVEILGFVRDPNNPLHKSDPCTVRYEAALNDILGKGQESGAPRPGHQIHYPLNGIDMDFRRYSRRPLGQRDILINRIAEDYMRPCEAHAKAYLHTTTCGSAIAQVKSLDHDFGVGLQLVSKMLETQWNVEESILDSRVKSKREPSAHPWYHCRNRVPGKQRNFYSLDEFIYSLLQRHFLETDLTLRVLFEYVEHYADEREKGICPAPKLKTPRWKGEIVDHLKRLKPNMEMQHRHGLFPGRNHQYPTYELDLPQFFIEPYLVAIPYSNLVRLLEQMFVHYFYLNFPRTCAPRRRRRELHNLDCVGRRRTRRSSSQPAPGAWCYVLWDRRYILFPRRPLSEVDKLSRRRSLSRTHIRAMFRDPPSVLQLKDLEGMGFMPKMESPCDNCTSLYHLTRHCMAGCGYCNSREHEAVTCPVNSINRCKCRPFPQFHTVSDCHIRCSRRCGSPYPPGHFKHKNAILCNHRCCMCGQRGHTGRKCNLRKCRCGEMHLTQDCRWKVECPVDGCDRYLCTQHCRECGKPRNKEYFVAMTCPDCLRNGTSFTPKAEEFS